MYNRAKSDLLNKFLYRHPNTDKLFVGYLTGPRRNRKFNGIMDSSFCEVVSLLALEVTTSEVPGACDKELQVAKSLVYTCYRLYMTSRTHLGPKLIEFDKDQINIKNAMNELDGDLAEALFLLYQATNDPIFQKWGWDIYLAIEDNAKVEYGYSGLSNVNEPGSYTGSIRPDFGSKTLKFLYLLFAPKTQIDVRNYVFNPSGHLYEI